MDRKLENLYESLFQLHPTIYPRRSVGGWHNFDREVLELTSSGHWGGVLQLGNNRDDYSICF